MGPRPPKTRMGPQPPAAGRQKTENKKKETYGTETKYSKRYA